MTQLTDVEIPYMGDIAENPNMSSVIDTQINEHLNIIEFQREFKQQYENFDALGFNVFKAYSYVDIPVAIIEDFLEYVHTKIISIPDYDIPNLALTKKEFLVKALYEILIIDMPTKHMDKLTTDDPIVLRDNIISIYALEIDVLSSMTPSITWEQLKAHFAQNLFDTDLESFVERYMIPVRSLLNN